MSAETTPKLETFLIVAYKPLRGSDRHKDPTITESSFNSKVSNFKLSEKESLFSEQLEGMNRTCVAVFGQRRTAALVSIGSSQVYTHKEQAPHNIVKIAGPQQFGECDLVLVWRDKLAIGLGQSKFAVVDIKTGNILFQSAEAFICKIATYSGHSYYSAYGRGAKIFNDCVLIATTIKKMVLVPLRPAGCSLPGPVQVDLG